MSYQRERSNAKIEEVNDLLASGRRIPFYQSFTAERMTNHYLQTFGAILDWSSIGQVHPLFSKDKHDQNMHWALRLSFDNIDCTEPLRSSSLDAPSSRIRGSTWFPSVEDEESTISCQGVSVCVHVCVHARKKTRKQSDWTWFTIISSSWRNNHPPLFPPPSLFLVLLLLLLLLLLLFLLLLFFLGYQDESGGQHIKQIITSSPKVRPLDLKTK